MTDKTKTEPLAPVKLMFDYWPDDSGNRAIAGTVVDLPISEAKRLLGEGKAERADPMPGEAA